MVLLAPRFAAGAFGDKALANGRASQGNSRQGRRWVDDAFPGGCLGAPSLLLLPSTTVPLLARWRAAPTLAAAGVPPRCTHHAHAPAPLPRCTHGARRHFGMGMICSPMRCAALLLGVPGERERRCRIPVLPAGTGREAVPAAYGTEGGRQACGRRPTLGPALPYSSISLRQRLDLGRDGWCSLCSALQPLFIHAISFCASSAISPAVYYRLSRTA